MTLNPIEIVKNESNRTLCEKLDKLSDFPFEGAYYFIPTSDFTRLMESAGERSKDIAHFISTSIGRESGYL
jgi:hypothetical protein